MKYEMLLKIFFGGIADNAVSIATIDAFEQEITRDLAVLKVSKANLARILNERDHLFFYLTVSFGVETYEAYLRWCSEAKELLSEKEN